jgi:hypothetical protein
MELLQPLRVIHVGLSSGHVLHVARVHEKHGSFPRFLDSLLRCDRTREGGSG